MVAHIFYFLIEVAVQTVFLTLGLWIMIVLQKLNYHFLGLLGTAALVSFIDRSLDLVLSHFLGFYLASSISTPFVLAVLYICLKKVTQADRTDIYFTVGIGYALVFGMNLWLLGALLGDLRPSARYSQESETIPLAVETNAAPQAAGKANPPGQSGIVQAKPAGGVAQQFAIKGITRNGANSVATVQCGTKILPIFLGEAVTMQTTDGPASVRFKELGDNWVVLTINGQDTKLPLQ